MVLCDNYEYAKNPKIKAVAFNDDSLNWFNLDQKTDNLIRIKYFKSKDNEFKETSPFFEIGFAADSIINLMRESMAQQFLFSKKQIWILMYESKKKLRRRN